MDSYGKVDPYNQSQLETSRKLRKRWFILSFVGILLVAAIIVGLVVGLRKRESNNGTQSTTNQLIVDACKSTQYPETCVTSLSAFSQGSSPTNPQDIIKMSFQIAIAELGQAVDLVQNLTQAEGNSSLASIFTDCKENLVASIQQMNFSALEFANISLQNLQSDLDDVTTMLSSALTLHSTCVDDILENITGNSTDQIRSGGVYVAELLSNALALFSSFSSAADGLPALPTRRLLSKSSQSEEQPDSLLYETEGGYPRWLSAGSRRLLADLYSRPNSVVAQDGSGKFRRIQDAVNAAPNDIKTGLYVIHVKAGVYWEQVSIPSSKVSIAIVGDGIGKTVIANNLNVQMKGMTTFKSATVAIGAPGVVFRDLTIQNRAGAAAHQAVALRVSADRVVIFRCSLEGNQDTLYAHNGRQFYTNSVIQGTVDFMFGNAAAVFQSCTLLALKPLTGQQVTLTAQGRIDRNQNTGFSFQLCSVVGSLDLQKVISIAPVYLGRPWKLYSRTVFIKCNLSFIVNKAGWLNWIGDFALKTLFYGEFQNTGAGAGTNQRVSWSTQMTARQAKEYNVLPFITRSNWITITGTFYLPYV
ncbi:hypothetical protein O6H91_14G073500 [Diphasiastrum complanatum]|uniref:Uncharacterized protein n=1 Tax=Diphasiastrum complanatum TaxID=34168 RepID=A0ACC2BQT8_DIPCM|nr:hypothetical protein O6H91_14G073500 [Diphasiastrum complanatum]